MKTFEAVSVVLLNGKVCDYGVSIKLTKYFLSFCWCWIADVSCACCVWCIFKFLSSVQVLCFKMHSFWGFHYIGVTQCTCQCEIWHRRILHCDNVIVCLH